jgi:predicted nucleic acid-binding protein
VRIALDTNILAYAEGVNDPEREAQAIRLTNALASDTTFVPVQVLGELFNVLIKRGFVRSRAQEAVVQWSETFILIGTTADLMLFASKIAVQHRLKIWDAVVLAAAREVGCSVLISEDLQNGFAWEGVTVCNPFLTKPHPLIADLVRA